MGIFSFVTVCFQSSREYVSEKSPLTATGLQPDFAVHLGERSDESDASLREQQVNIRVYNSVSYTHLTLPTIYSV